MAKTENNSVKDIDGNTYNLVQIGKQIWTAENLNVSKFRNGDEIKEVTDANEWNKADFPDWCYYENDKEKYGGVIGKLYNFYAVTDERGLAPEGWEIPTVEDFEQLATNVGGVDCAYKLKSKKAGTWSKKEDVTKATDEFGFSVIGVGSRAGGSWGAPFMNRLIYASLWTNTFMDEHYALTCSFSCWHDNISTVRSRAESIREKQVGCSVRIKKK